jgi:flagellar basal-body rod modification protein FlgD
MTTVNPSTSSTANAAATTTATNNSISGNFNQFLTLLTTQLKYQDPLSPMDSTQFTAQLAQFATVEQTSNLNTSMNSLLSIEKANQTAYAVNYIGKNVSVNSPSGGLINGQMDFKYLLSGTASTSQLVVKNAAGETVLTTDGETSAGVHDFAWDGKDSNGNQLPDGLYTLSVTSVDSKGNPVAASVSSSGQVTGVDSSTGTLNLVVNGVEIPFDQILAVQN